MLSRHFWENFDLNLGNYAWCLIASGFKCRNINNRSDNPGRQFQDGGVLCIGDLHEEEVTWSAVL